MTTQTSGTIRFSSKDDKADKPRIHEIAVAAWTPIFDRYRRIVGDDMWNGLWAGWEKDWLTAPDAFVTELDGQIVGFATWHSPIEGVLAELGANAVHPKFQGRGIGTTQMRYLMQKFSEWGYPCAKVHTGLDPAHGPARAEYRKVGLQRGIKNSRYYNDLDEVARIPIRAQLSFRWAEPNDAPLVREMAQSAWRTVYDGVNETLGDEIFNRVFKTANQQKADKYAKVVADTPEKIRIATESGKPAGFSFLDLKADKKLGDISTIGVSADLKSRGIGCALCMDAFEIFREQELRYAGLYADLGEANEKTRQMCWNVGLYREIPSIDYYMML